MIEERQRLDDHGRTALSQLFHTAGAFFLARHRGRYVLGVLRLLLRHAVGSVLQPATRTGLHRVQLSPQLCLLQQPVVLVVGNSWLLLLLLLLATVGVRCIPGTVVLANWNCWHHLLGHLWLLLLLHLLLLLLQLLLGDGFQ